MGVDLDISLTNILWAELLWVLAWLVCYPTGIDGTMRPNLESWNEKSIKLYYQNLSLQ